MQEHALGKITARLRALADERGQIRRAPVCAAAGVSTHTLRRWAEQGKFPSPLRLGPKLFIYDVETVVRALYALYGVPAEAAAEPLEAGA